MQTRFTHRLLTGAGLAACAIALVAAKPAAAQLEAITSFQTNNFSTNTGLTLGYTFSLTQAVNVTDLGYFDYQANGLGEAHGVGIYNNAGTLLFSTTVPAGTVGSTLGNTFSTGGITSAFRYVAVAPQLLSSGIYTIGGFSGTAGVDNYGLLGSSVNTSPPVVYGTGMAVASGGGLSPTAPVGGSAPNSYFGPSFRFTTAPAVAGPEPGTLALLGTGLVSMGGVAVRRRKKSAK